MIFGLGLRFFGAGAFSVSSAALVDLVVVFDLLGFSSGLGGSVLGGAGAGTGFSCAGLEGAGLVGASGLGLDFSAASGADLGSAAGFSTGLALGDSCEVTGGSSGFTFGMAPEGVRRMLS